MVDYAARFCRRQNLALFGEASNRGRSKRLSSSLDQRSEAVKNETSTGADFRKVKSVSPGASQKDEAVVQVPPVFLWIKRKSRTTKSKLLSETAKHAHFDGTHEHKDIPALQDSGNSISEAQISDEEVLAAIVEDVDSGLSKSQDHNMDLIGGDRYRGGEIYKNIIPATPAEVTSLLKILNTVPERVQFARQQKRKATWQQRLSCACDSLTSLFNFFLPVPYSCKVSGKYWGSVAAMVKTVEKMYEPRQRDNVDAAEGLHKPRDMKLSSFFIIDLSTFTDDRAVDPTCLPAEQISDCEECRKRKCYYTFAQALDHLRGYHFLNQSVSDDELARWVATPQQLFNYQLGADAVELLDKLNEHCSELVQQQIDIRHGVCTRGEFDHTVYGLPRGLVKAFQRILMLVAYISHVGSMALKMYSDCSHDASPITFIDNKYRKRLTQLGFGAEGAFEDSKNDLMLMSRTGDYSHSMCYEAIGMEYVLMLLLCDLQERTYADDSLALCKRYGEYAMRLQYQSIHPHSIRLLKQVNSFREELNIIDDLFTEQWNATQNFVRVLRPEGFQVTSQNRKASWRSEVDVVNRFYQRARNLNGVRDLVKKADVIAFQARQHIEIQHEDHGKAILVFTTVTIIFLPLSFVTSLLGMNTADVRTLQVTQWVFWATALPLTVVVVILAISVGYRSEQLRSALERLFSKMVTPAMLAVDRRRSAQQELQASDDDDDDGRSMRSEGNGVVSPTTRKQPKRRWADRVKARKKHARDSV